MKTKIFYLAMYILAVLPLMTACEKEEQPSIGQTQLATPVVAVKIDVYAKTIIVSWQAVENADNYHYKISGDEILHGTRETSLELLPFSQFLEGNHSIMVQAVNTYDPEQFIASEWCKVDFSVESTKLRVPESLNCDVDKENCSVNVSWTPVENAFSYLYKIDDGEEIAAAGTEVSFSLFDYTPGEHCMSVRALAEEMSPDHLASDWSEAYFTITDEPLPGMLGNKPLDHARLGDFYLNDGSLLRGDSELSKELADACIGIVFYAGRHETDQSDYTRPLTAGGPVLGSTVHGYVVSLTQAPFRKYYAEDISHDKWGYWEKIFLDDRACNATSYQDPWDFGNLVLAADLETRRKHVVMYMGIVVFAHPWKLPSTMVKRA